MIDVKRVERMINAFDPTRMSLMPLLAITIILASCWDSGVRGEAGRAIDTGSVYILDEAEFENRRAKADMGDSSSSFDVYMHLSAGGENFGSPERDEVYWRKRAADQGDLRAQQHLLVNALSQGTPEGCALARQVIQKYTLTARIKNREIRISQQDLNSCGIRT